MWTSFWGNAWWTCTETTAAWRAEFRNVYIAYYSKGPRKGQRGVCKVFKDTTLANTSLLEPT